MKRWLKRLAKTLLGLLAGLLLLLALGLALLQTEWVRGRLLMLAELGLREQGLELELRGLSGRLPFSVQLQALDLADAKGTWLELRDLRLSWSPGDLLRGRVRIDELSARRLALARAPELPQDAEPEPFEPPRLPEGLPPLVLDHLELGRIELGAPVLGEAVTLSLIGQARAQADGRAGFQVRLLRTDQPSAELSLDTELDPVQQRLRLDLTAEESGGLLSRLLEQPEAGPWRLRLDGDAPWADWQARLALQAGDLGEVEGDLRLALGETPRLGVDARLGLAPSRLPAELAPVWDGQARLLLQLTQENPDRWQLQGLRLEAGPGVLEAGADLDWDAGELAARAQLVLADLSRLEPLAGSELSGAVKLELTLGERLSDPRAELVLQATGLHLSGAEIEGLESRFHVRFLGSLEQGYTGFDLTGEGGARGLRLEALPELVPEPLNWELALTAPAGGAAELHRLRLTGGPLHATLTGRIDPADLSGSLQLQAGADDLAPLSGDVLSGSLELGLDAQLAAGLDRVRAAFQAQGRGLRGLPPAVAVLLGDEPGLNADLELAGRTRASLHDLKLRAPGMTLAGSAQADIESQALSGRLALSIPDLAPLGEALANPLAGSLSLGLDLAGSILLPELAVQAQGRELSAAGLPLERLDLALNGTDLAAAPAGHLRLRLGPEDQALALAGDYRLQDRRLDLSALRLEGPGSEFSGDLRVDLSRPLLDGSLAGTVDDLAALGFWHRTPGLAGGLELDLELKPQAGAQDLRLKLQGEGLSPGAGYLQSLGVELGLADLFGRPSLRAEVSGQGFEHPELPLERLHLSAEGSLDDLGLKLALHGGGDLVASLEAGARLRLPAGRTELALSALDGELFGKVLHLKQPALLVQTADRLSLDGLDLQLGAGHLQAAGGLGGGEAALEARIEALDLAPLASLGGLPLAGRADARLALTGKPQQPDLALDLHLQDLSWPAAREEGLAPAELALQANLAKQRLEAELTTQVLGPMPLRVSAGLPVKFSLQPFAVVLADDAPLTGSLSGPIDLARLGELLVLDDQSLAGLATSDLRLTGRLDAPGLDGTLTLSGGRYENGLAGVLIQDIEFEFRARDRELVLDRLSASDGKAGSLSGGGRVRLPRDGELGYQAHLDLSRMELVRSYQANATLSGNLELEGTSAGAALAGALTLDQAEIRIPEKLGPDVPELEVVEVHAPEERRRQKFRHREENGFAIQLDLGLDIPSRAFVRGRGLESEWRGALRIQGDSRRPKVLGALRVHRGWLDVLDRRFTLAEGVVDFNGSWPPIPDLRIRAESQGREILGIVNLNGPANDPKLTLESQPSLPQDEVLARLLFDSPLDEITPTQALQLAAAVNSLAQGGSGGGFDLMGKTRSGLGLDTLDFESTGANSGSVKAGKYLREDVYLEVTGGLDEGGSRARVEWDLTPSISVESAVDQQSRSSFGLNWKLDY